MSNMYGYLDYNGPAGVSVNDESTTMQQVDYDDQDDDDDPLRSGLWMEGDSLAPPCGTDVSTIHKLLSFAQVSANDILYDFGCGDGRICLEALVRHDCAQCVGVEVEEDLVLRFQDLISKLPGSKRDRIMAIHADLRHVLTALLKRAPECHQNGSSKQGSATLERCETNPTLSNLPMPTILVLYLLPEAIQELECDLIQLLRLLPRFRIVCNTWGLPRWKASKTVQMEATNGGGASTVFYLYTNASLP